MFPICLCSRLTKSPVRRGAALDSWMGPGAGRAARVGQAPPGALTSSNTALTMMVMMKTTFSRTTQRSVRTRRVDSAWQERWRVSKGLAGVKPRQKGTWRGWRETKSLAVPTMTTAVRITRITLKLTIWLSVNSRK